MVCAYLQEKARLLADQKSEVESKNLEIEEAKRARASQHAANGKIMKESTD